MKIIKTILDTIKLKRKEKNGKRSIIIQIYGI